MVHWLRQLAGLGVGFMLGLLRVKGFLLGFGLFLFVSVTSVPAMVSRLHVDNAQMGEVLSFEMAKEGFAAAFALFMVCAGVRRSAGEPTG